MSRRVTVTPKAGAAAKPAMRRKPRLFLRPLMFTLGFLYLGFHAMHGERGLYAWLRDLRLHDNVEQELAQARIDREALELKVSHMRDGSLDLDLLDEQVRRMLGGLHDDEIVVLVK